MFSWADIGLAGSFGALLAGWLVVVARGLYLARHLFTLYHIISSIKNQEKIVKFENPAVERPNEGLSRSMWIFRNLATLSIIQ